MAMYNIAVAGAAATGMVRPSLLSSELSLSYAYTHYLALVLTLACARVEQTLL